ncbi:hypothetical protein Naga_101494g1 [Nannochloropsis gaditana]|uniref:Uncharacterized protein n=1 Tax=Nannochloropsis gaditana TaxID=72520 RepID=W7TZH5_9STRA|nr:hypothetical protein Naga_101494g1 [Nannochloropsis gaditana]
MEEEGVRVVLGGGGDGANERDRRKAFCVKRRQPRGGREGHTPYGGECATQRVNSRRSVDGEACRHLPEVYIRPPTCCACLSRGRVTTHFKHEKRFSGQGKTHLWSGTGVKIGQENESLHVVGSYARVLEKK